MAGKQTKLFDFSERKKQVIRTEKIVHEKLIVDGKIGKLKNKLNSLFVL